MPAGKVTIKADFTAQTADSVFADVSADAYYYEAVKWAADKGITGGIGDSCLHRTSPAHERRL